MVRLEGVEPPRLAALDPKSSVSANSTTSARTKSEFKYQPMTGDCLGQYLITFSR